MRALLASLVIVVACGGDDGGSAIDAPQPIVDSPSGTPDAVVVDADPSAPDADTIDADPGAPDALVDAAMSSVIVAAGPCADEVVSFTAEGGAVWGGSGCPDNDTNCQLTITAGDSIEFESLASHNAASAVGTPLQFQFRSGNVGQHTACLTFTAAGSVDFRCELHATMTGTITIN